MRIRSPPPCECVRNEARHSVLRYCETETTHSRSLPLEAISCDLFRLMALYSCPKISCSSAQISTVSVFSAARSISESDYPDNENVATIGGYGPSLSSSPLWNCRSLSLFLYHCLYSLFSNIPLPWISFPISLSLCVCVFRGSYDTAQRRASGCRRCLYAELGRQGFPLALSAPVLAIPFSGKKKKT